jgi:hypothetical protein
LRFPLSRRFVEVLLFERGIGLKKREHVTPEPETVAKDHACAIKSHAVTVVS